MFDKTAAYYDLLYEKGLGKDYAAEVAYVSSLLPPSTRTLLDVACGTGLHLQHFAARYACVGTDLDAGMLAVARARCPDLPLVEADMVTLDLGDQRFDAIVCLFSSIGYTCTPDRLHRAVAAIAGHLGSGGTLVVEPWLTPDAWIPGHIGMLTVDEPDVKICRLNRSVLDDGCSVMEFQYLVAAAGTIEHLTEVHRLGLFTWDQYRDAFEAAGLETTIDRIGGPMGRGFLVGRRR